ncbi:MAG: hypothetical protein IKL36_02030, partial [Clostridia bacterium]|nr:hypothetical protein [Clostridia bacterium]
VHRTVIHSRSPSSPFYMPCQEKTKSFDLDFLAEGLDSRRYDAKPSFHFGFAALLGQSRI